MRTLSWMSIVGMLLAACGGSDSVSSGGGPDAGGRPVEAGSDASGADGGSSGVEGGTGANPTDGAGADAGTTGDASTDTGAAGEAGTDAGTTGDASTDAGTTGDASTDASTTGDASTDASDACVPVAETCDGTDEDCDGEVDNGFEQVGTGCSAPGACGTGVWECDGTGGVICSAAPGGSEDASHAELCDGTDADCDGAIDCDDADCASEPACTCNLDGSWDGEPDEACDDGNACSQDGCVAGTCQRESSLVVTEMQVASGGVGFDLDNVDGDGDAYTGIDNAIGSSPTLAGALNGFLADGLSAGAVQLLTTLTDVDSFEDDAEVSQAFQRFIDPSCGAVLPPAWLAAPGASVYGDPTWFPGCTPLVGLSDADDAENGVYPTAQGPTAAPALRMATAQLLLPLGFWQPALRRARLQGTLANDGAFFTALTDGLLAGVLTPATLGDLSTVGTGLEGLCPTALHVVLGLLGGPDIDMGGSGLDAIAFTSGTLPCILSGVTITGCVDGDTGAAIAGANCVDDPRMSDGYSIALQWSAHEVRVRESAPPGYCL